MATLAATEIRQLIPIEHLPLGYESPFLSVQDSDCTRFSFSVQARSHDLMRPPHLRESDRPKVTRSKRLQKYNGSPGQGLAMPTTTGICTPVVLHCQARRASHGARHSDFLLGKQPQFTQQAPPQTGHRTTGAPWTPGCCDTGQGRVNSQTPQRSGRAGWESAPSTCNTQLPARPRQLAPGADAHTERRAPAGTSGDPASASVPQVQPPPRRPVSPNTL